MGSDPRFIGFHTSRLAVESKAHGHLREVAFAEAWRDENSPAETMYNKATATALFMDCATSGSWSEKWVDDTKPSEREYRAMATAIQWLGTNVGFCFLHDTLAKVGLKIVTTEVPNDHP